MPYRRFHLGDGYFDLRILRCGCRLLFILEDGRIMKMLPDRTDNPSEGTACTKGLTIHQTMSTDESRILNPMVRNHKSEPFSDVPWNGAYRFISKQTKDLAPSEFFINASGRITNEDCYVTQKSARIAYKTNNVDACCAR
jgi:formate dehydrogenase (coenzyme F420) alpha subunit